MSAILLALISFTGWGTGDIFGTIASRKIGGYATTLWAFLLGFCIFSLYIPFALADAIKFTLPLFFVSLFLGLLSLAGNIAFNEGVRVGNPSLVGTISSAFTAVTIVLSTLFLKETITVKIALIIVIIFIGVVITSLDFKAIQSKKSFLNRGVFLALLSMLLWGIFFTGTKALGSYVGWFWPQYIAYALFPLIYVYMRWSKIVIIPVREKKITFSLFLNALFLRSGDFAFQFGLARHASYMIAPIAGSYPVLLVILAFLIFREPVTKQQIFGIITTLVGIVLLSFSGA